MTMDKLPFEESPIKIVIFHSYKGNPKNNTSICIAWFPPKKIEIYSTVLLYLDVSLNGGFSPQIIH